MAPIGTINAGDPKQAYQDGYNIAGLNGDGSNRAAAATIAAGVAAAFCPDATHETVVEAMTRHSAPLVRRSIELTMRIADESGSPDEFVERFYDRMLDWWSRPHRDRTPTRFAVSTGVETVPVVMALLRLCEGDVNRFLIEGASFGRDADAIASLAGSLAGTLQGAGAVRQHWIETCERANEAFFREVEGTPAANFRSVAERMTRALRGARDRAATRLVMLDAILAGFPAARADA